MVKIEPACVNCPPEVCRGKSCNRKVYSCDLCEEECDSTSSDPRDWLYDLDGDELCWTCAMDAAGILVVDDE